MVDDSSPSPGELGNYIGAQMAAVNLDVAAPPTPTPTDAPPPTCGGDCSGDGAVTVDEIVTGVTIALGSAALDACSAADGDGDGQVVINELIAAVQNLLAGCGA